MNKRKKEKLGLMPTSLATRLSLMTKYPSFPIRFLPKALKMLSTSALLQPIDLFERMKYRKAIDACSLEDEHVFIIGQWRSGTTHLHNIMMNDNQFATASTFQVIFPNAFISLNPLKGLLNKLVPDTRQFDHAKISFDSPQEDEVALAYLSPYSIYHCFFYPSRLREYCQKYAALQNISASEFNHLSSQYAYFLKKLVYAAKGKSLMLKNPTNTGRIPLILDLVPNAKFIYIQRDPFKATLSESLALKVMMDECTLEDFTLAQLEEAVIDNYGVLFDKYNKDKSRVPSDRLVEIKFEDLMHDPMPEIEKIYRQLGLGGFKKAKENIVSYLNQEKDYQHNSYDFSPSFIKKVRSKLGHVLDEWGYSQEPYI